MGNLLCVHVHAGNIHDTKGGVYTLEKALYHYPTLIGVCADQGYRGTFKNTFEIFHKIDCQVKCNTIREKIFEAPRMESGN